MKKNFKRFIIIVLTILVLIPSIFVMPMTVGAYSITKYAIMMPRQAGVYIRSAPTTNDSIIVGYLHAGDAVCVLGENFGTTNAWSKIIFDGNEAYVSTQFLADIARCAVVKNSNPYVRSAPTTTENNVVGLLHKGDQLYVLGDNFGVTGTWSKIIFNGEIAYVSTQFLPVIKEVSGDIVNLKDSADGQMLQTASYLDCLEFVQADPTNSQWSKVKVFNKITNEFDDTIYFVHNNYIRDYRANNLIRESNPLNTVKVWNSKAGDVFKEAMYLYNKRTPYLLNAPALSTAAMDCSSFVQYLFYECAGYSGNNLLMRNANNQSKDTTKGVVIPFSGAASVMSLKLGDCIYFNYKDEPGGREVDHVGVYIGNGEMIHASASAGQIKISPFGGNWIDRVYNVKRYL